MISADPCLNEVHAPVRSESIVELPQKGKPDDQFMSCLCLEGKKKIDDADQALLKQPPANHVKPEKPSTADTAISLAMKDSKKNQVKLLSRTHKFLSHL